MHEIETMNQAITGVSSMATRDVLAELSAAYERRSGRRVLIESKGGVVAARRLTLWCWRLM
jgi:molybdate transport system substrate-binding protein